MPESTNQIFCFYHPRRPFEKLCSQCGIPTCPECSIKVVWGRDEEKFKNTVTRKKPAIKKMDIETEEVYLTNLCPKCFAEEQQYNNKLLLSLMILLFSIFFIIIFIGGFFLLQATPSFSDFFIFSIASLGIGYAIWRIRDYRLSKSIIQNTQKFYAPKISPVSPPSTPPAQIPLTPLPAPKTKEEFINCPKCNVQLPVNSKFCMTCGLNIEEYTMEELFCPNCGTQLPRDAQFCYSCGLKIEKNKEESNK